jgi:hypothetical protein
VTRRTFRSAVMQGPHGPRPEPGLQFFPGRMTKEQAADGIVGTCFDNLPSASDRTLTLWLLRDFVDRPVPQSSDYGHGLGISSPCSRGSGPICVRSGLLEIAKLLPP